MIVMLSEGPMTSREKGVFSPANPDLIAAPQPIPARCWRRTNRVSTSRLRVAIVADFAEEGWPSMDLVADELFDRLRANHSNQVSSALVRPPFRRRFSHRAASPTGFVGGAHAAGDADKFQRARFNLDRLLNRFVDYPRHLQRLSDNFDVFHITDHSYAHLVRTVSPSRAIVTCHDLDAFRIVLDAATQSHPRRLTAMPLRLMAARQLRGLRRAAVVACVSLSTRQELLQHRLIATDRTVTIPNGVAGIFAPCADLEADREAARMLGPAGADIFEILHVGSTIPRKRIDILLRTFAAIRAIYPDARLLRVGGPFTSEQGKLARELHVENAAVVLPFVTSAVLAAIYRRASVVMIPSEREGFGLPLVEAMACGAPVIASDLAVLHEIGGAAVEFAPVGDVSAWVSVALRLIRERIDDPVRSKSRCTKALKHAANFSWSEYARRYVELYRRVAG
jgi:glycosyltransferase involved in cell wall biosynthesis